MLHLDRSLWLFPCATFQKAGVNCDPVSLDSPEHIISAASCTTNAIVPVLKVLDDEFGASLFVLSFLWVLNEQ